MLSLSVLALAPEYTLAAAGLASRLGLPLVPSIAQAHTDAVLQLGVSGLWLQPLGPGASGAIGVDFRAGAMRHRRAGGQNEMLGRAVGAGKRPQLRVLDATAGLGRDGFILADLGCIVTMVERSPVVHALLEDGLQRALAGSDDRVHQACSRISLRLGDAGELLRAASPDVVFLDPMFPARSKSARVKKEMWLFQALLEGEVAEPQLLQAALASAVYRVVVKRPARADALGSARPSFQIAGKSIRYDVYTLRKLA